jgi:citrate lyase subunit beta/citryl-CoA lyase
MMNNTSFGLMRSLLFVPAHNEKLMNKASSIHADVLLLDLEDSVKPNQNKLIAREMILKYVKANRFQNKKIFPRINDRESGELLRDIYELTIDGIDGFMYPKSCTGQDIYFIDKLLETVEYEKGFPIGRFKLIPLIETTSAVLQAQDICKASKRVVAIAFGCEDFVTDLQGVHDLDGQSIFTARAMIAMAARANNVIPVDTVHIRVHDLDDLEKNLILAKKMGYEGMLVLNPKEIPLVHKYFTPSLQEVEHAETLLANAEIAMREGRGVAVIDNQFIGPPMVEAAEKVLAKHRLVQKYGNDL